MMFPKKSAEQLKAAVERTAKEITDANAKLATLDLEKLDLPMLNGSEKQIAWAEDIRKKFLSTEDGRLFVKRSIEFRKEVEAGTVDARGWGLVYCGILRRGLTILTSTDAHAIIEAR